MELNKQLISEPEVPSFSSYYTSLKKDLNNFSYWFPHIKDCGLDIPESIIIPVPEIICESFFMEHSGDKDRIAEWIKSEVLTQVPSTWNSIFIKNGSFSNKFDFATCHPTLDDIVKSVIDINYMSFMFDTGGNTELVVREYIESDKNFNKTIYNGMLLRPEVRCFYDFDNRKLLYSVNYWDWDYCHDRICERESDKNVYEDVYPHIVDYIDKHINDIEQSVSKAMKNVDGLSGIWSVDIMCVDNKYYLIDMAEGYRSAYYDIKRINNEES